MGGSGGPDMTGGSSELLIDPSAELRKRKLIELAKARPRPAVRTWRQRLWFYTTSFFVLAAVAAGSCILFLVPLYVDPAISTLVADFVPEPVLCTTLRVEEHSGIFNCTWSSCREGCTSDMYRCTHIYVNYTAYGNDSEHDGEATLLVNIKGCGYPPDVSCSNFSAEYGREGAVFPCYYSRQNRTVVMRHYNRDRQVEIIINYFAIPFVITVVTAVVLCVMHCDCRRAQPPAIRRTRIHDQRTYKKKTDQKPLTQALYEQACRLINAGSSIRQASKAIGFSDTALRKRLKEGKGGSQLGRFRKVLSAAQEKDLVRHCVELDKRFFGLTLKSLRYLLYSYAKKNNIPCPFPDSSQMAGRDFTRMFMKRNRLSLRTPRKTSVARTMGFNRVQLTQYFENLGEALKKYKFLPERIYNMDETGVQTVPNKLLRHVAPVGKKEVAKSVSAEQGKTVTVVCAMSCVGHFVPPYFIFARKRENRLLIKGGPTGCDMAVTDKGYMNTATFLKWLAHFKRFTNPVPENPILIILDNHVSHISLAAVNFAKSNNIHLLTLPPHSSHKTQPLDRCFFRPFKAYYDAAADSWLTSRPGQTISEFEIAELVKIAFEKSATVEMAAQAFCSTGICPYDRNKFTDADFLPAEVTEQEPDEAEPQDSEDVDEQRFIVFDQEIVDPPVQALEPVVSMEQDSPLQEHPAQIHVAIPLAEPSTSVSGSRDSQPSIASPEDIIPLPRIKIKRKRTGRGLKSVLITSTPHKEHLEEQERERAEKEKNKLARKTRKLLFPSAKPKPKRAKANPPTPICSSSDNVSSYSLHNSSSDFDDLNELFLSSEEDLEPAEQDERKLHQNNFAVVKVQGKTKNSMRLYVARILHVHIDGYDVLFYKRIPQSQRFSETIEEAFIESDDIFMSLSEPVKNTSGRFQNTITFGNDLSSFPIY